MGFKAYVRYPCIHGDDIVFTAEDDLWRVPSCGGRAERLTATAGIATRAAFSPGGERIAYVDQDEGHAEVYVMDPDGGAAKRLTWDAARAQVAGWTPDGSDIVYSSSRGQSLSWMRALHAVAAEGGEPQLLPWGAANGIAYGPDGALVVARNQRDPVWWKRYRGGTAGSFWIDRNGSGGFERFPDFGGSLDSPCWIGGRLFFISDHEGVGAVYSCDISGAGLRRHCPLGTYYARNLKCDGRRLVWHAGGDLFLLDPDSDGPRRVDAELPGVRGQRARRFAAAGRFLDSWRLHPAGHMVAVTDRGKAFTMGNWEGAVVQHGEADGVRYRQLCWLPDGRRLAAVRDDGGEPGLVVFDPQDGSERRIDGPDIGHVVGMAASPKDDRLLVANHRSEIIIVELPSGSSRVVDRSEYGSIDDEITARGIAWSPDGRWAAYSFAISPWQSVIKVADAESGGKWQVTDAVMRDTAPAFDPGGRYLYFIGARCFDPVFDAQAFDFGFPKGTKPYLVALRADIVSPFASGPEADKDDAAEGKDEGKDKESKDVGIDFEGIADRIVPFPVPEGRYFRVGGLPGGAVFASCPVEGSRDLDIFETAPQAKAVLERWDFRLRKRETLAEGIGDFGLDPGGRHILYRAGERLRVMKSGAPAPEGGKAAAGDEPGRESGWIDLGRVKVSVKPELEWRQMFAEAWRLQREQFWVEDMSGVNWKAMYERYVPLVDRLASRAELSDLIWELQGELGTSHAYELGGDYRATPDCRQGFLGVDWALGLPQGPYLVARVIRGDPWDPDASSPFLVPGAGIRAGDWVLAINGQQLSSERGPQELLADQGGREVEVLVKPAGGGEARTVTVRALTGEYKARYRDWVEANRRKVHEATNGRIGYLHVPDMTAEGFAEFHRYYPLESDREGLVVDLRWNAGGMVSGLLLEKLARKRVGYRFPRRSPPESYPGDAPRGPMVALANENAGSDGDIFCHSFKLMGLGPLVGKRTWGGVVGFLLHGTLSDGSLTTQPENCFWFKDVKWGLENHGTDPDIDVDISPGDYAAGLDPQLDCAVAEVLRLADEWPEKVPGREGGPRLGYP
ncbi:MAG: PDZ domain-containing protein [Spirochaetes bacterium]|nr:PDZ domain-containing protein [Spirochaetota bacterium]